MKESEFIKGLSGEYFKVGTVENAESNPIGQAIRISEGIIWKRVAVYEKHPDEDILSARKLIFYYVVDSGKDTEQVYLQEKKLEKQFAKVPVIVQKSGLFSRLLSAIKG